MSENSKVIGMVEIKCPKCGCNQSYQKILFNYVSEFGECTLCGALTYNKVLNGLSSNPLKNIQCPYCHSTNVKKISTTSKIGSVALFGIFAAGKVAKEWHCNNCKSDF